jgi:hypothetical protein
MAPKRTKKAKSDTRAQLHAARVALREARNAHARDTTRRTYDGATLRDDIELARAAVTDATNEIKTVIDGYQALIARYASALDLFGTGEHCEHLLGVAAEARGLADSAENRLTELSEAIEAHESELDDTHNLIASELDAAIALARAVQAPQLRPSTWETLEDQAYRVENELRDLTVGVL